MDRVGIEPTTLANFPKRRSILDNGAVVEG